MNTQTYLELTGQLPMNDDLDRVNCEHAGEVGHIFCGWCPIHNCPRFTCMCRILKPRISHQHDARQAAEAAATA